MPNDTELSAVGVEQELLGALLVNNNAFLHISHLEPKHFYEPLHQRIFTYMMGIFSGGNHFSAVTLKPVFDADPALIDIEGGAYLFRLTGSGVAVLNIIEHANLLIDLSLRRALVAACNKAKADICDLTGESATEAALSLSDSISSIASDEIESFFYDDYQVTEAILEDMKRDVRPYPTGYANLDAAMDGGLYPGKSYGFAARKKMGKTILAGSISHNLNVAAIRHLFICGEMSPAEVQKRTLARQLRVKGAMFNSREGRAPEFMDRIAATAMGSKRAVIYRNAPGITFEDLKRYVLLARLRKKITGFILDYWQLVGGKPKGKSTAEHLDEVAQWIADTCRKYDLWSITMAQINQEGNTRGGEGIRLAFDQVYSLQAPGDDAGRTERWLEMSDTRYTPWRSVGSANKPGLYLNEFGPYFSETLEDGFEL